MFIWANYSDLSRGHPKWWCRESSQNPFNSGLGIIVICPGLWTVFFWSTSDACQLFQTTSSFKVRWAVTLLSNALQLVSWTTLRCGFFKEWMGFKTAMRGYLDQISYLKSRFIGDHMSIHKTTISPRNKYDFLYELGQRKHIFQQLRQQLFQIKTSSGFIPAPPGTC